MRGTSASRRAWGIAAGVGVVFVGIGTLMDAVRGGHLSYTRLGAAAVYLPLLFFTLSAVFARTRAARLHPAVIVGLTVSSGLAMAGAAVASLALLRVSFPMFGQAFGVTGDVPFARYVASSLVLGVMQTGVWAIGFLYPFSIEDAAARERETERLRAAAELARLRASLEPHFLLNTLNAIAGLMVDEPEEARELVALLSDLLHDAVEDRPEIHSLGEEAEWLGRYAKILEIRHRGMLSFRWEIDPAAREALLPRLLLQPLVENAARHGALRRPGGGEIGVHATVEGGTLRVVVRDNGPGPRDAAGGAGRGRVGLAAVARRVAHEYPGATVVLARVAGLTEARVEVPGVRLEAAAVEPALSKRRSWPALRAGVARR